MLSLLLASAFAGAPSAEVVDYSDAWRALLAERRAANVARLEAYAEAGRFPLNLDEPGLAHLFMDASGSRCGVAELVWQSGHEALVVDTYQVRNDVVIAELGLGDPLAEWVAVSGLTMSEVAFIQRPAFRVGIEPEAELLLADLEEPLPVEPVVDPDLLALETQVRQAHFAMAAKQLTLTTERSLDRAVLALGDRVLSPPPAGAWSSDLPHLTVLPAPEPPKAAKVAKRRRARG